MNQVLVCVHKWSTWLPITLDENGNPLHSLCRDYQEGDPAWRHCSRCDTWHVNRDPEPRIVLGRLEDL